MSVRPFHSLENLNWPPPDYMLLPHALAPSYASAAKLLTYCPNKRFLRMSCQISARSIVSAMRQSGVTSQKKYTTMVLRAPGWWLRASRLSSAPMVAAAALDLPSPSPPDTHSTGYGEGSDEERGGAAHRQYWSSERIQLESPLEL